MSGGHSPRPFPFNTRSHTHQVLLTITRAGLGGQAIMRYIVKQGGTQQHHAVTLDLLTTPCQYGGVRWWFACPDCAARVRVLYLPISTRDPACRRCLSLQYASQGQSDIEKQRTYEFHLLKHFGYTWARMAHLSLQHHYLTVTPAMEEMRLKSVIDGQLRFLRRIISFEKVMLATHLQVLRAIGSEEKQ